MSVSMPGMDAASVLQKTGAGSAAPAGRDVLTIDKSDAAQFQAAMDKHSNKGLEAPPLHDKNKESMGDQMMKRADKLSTDVKADQQYVSKLLEKATASGDSMQLMKAMMAMNDYQMRVQVISKTVSKATSSLDQLTKLQ